MNVDLKANMPQALVSMVTKKIAGSVVPLLVREAQKVTALGADTSGCALAADNPYLSKVKEGGPFYTYVGEFLQKYFEMFGDGHQGGGAAAL